MVRALVEHMGRQPMRKLGDRGHRVQRLVQIGRMPLLADNLEMRRHRPATPDLDHVADVRAGGRFPHDTDIHALAGFRHPVENGDGAVAPGPSSSPVIAMTIAPSGGASARGRRPPPRRPRRPISCRSRHDHRASRPPDGRRTGGCVQSAGSPTGTTSVWPLNPRTRRAFRGPSARTGSACRCGRRGCRRTPHRAAYPPAAAARRLPPASRWGSGPGRRSGRRDQCSIIGLRSLSVRPWVTPWRERHNGCSWSARP
jgi:hypothetical protein